MAKKAIIIGLLAATGCGEAPPLVHTSRELFTDLGCDIHKNVVGDEGIYLYTEFPVEGTLSSVQLCNEGLPFAGESCEQTTNYSVGDDGVVRVLCGHWDDSGFELVETVRIGQRFPIIDVGVVK
jgi:hypothetical protein